MDFRIIPESLPDSVKTEYLLRDMSLGEVVRITRAALNKMDYGARNTHKIELWVRNEYDKQGNIDYLKHMINCGKLRYKDILDIFKFYNPFLELDPTRPIDWLDTIMREKKKEEVFLTDDFDYVPVPKKVVITNPRWEHKDATKKENSPKKAAFDDTAILMADITGIPENGPVTFEIFDTSVKPPKAVGSAKGKNVGGVAKGEWVVTDKTGLGMDAELEFQASAKSRTSARCKIEYLKKELLGCITLCLKNTISDHILGDVDCILNGQGIELTGKTDSNGLVSWNELPIGDYTILIKMGEQNVEKVVFWKNSPKKIQVIKIRQDIE